MNLHCEVEAVRDANGPGTCSEAGASTTTGSSSWPMDRRVTYVAAADDVFEEQAWEAWKRLPR
jgi:hypothetical protein